MNKYNINQTTLGILGLFRGDYRLSLHLREIARRIGVDVKAVQIQLLRLEQEGILRRVDRGRIKDYSLSIEDPLPLYYMVLAEVFMTTAFLTRNFVIKKVAEGIMEVDGVILLYGVHAEGVGKEGDPITLLVIAGKGPEVDTISELGSRISREIMVKVVDRAWFLQGLAMRDPLISGVASNHVVLKGIDDLCRIMRQHAVSQGGARGSL
jgi:DNA-binding Lrp family transcriptional regulator